MPGDPLPQTGAVAPLRRPDAVFLHVPKAAGSTLNRLLNRLYPPELIFQHDAVEDQDRGAVWKRSREELARYRLLRGHIPLEWVRRQWPQDPPPCFTMLRDPVARVISHYRYARRTPTNGLHGAAQRSIESFLDADDVQFDNLQVRLLSGRPPWSVPRGACPDSWLEDARRALRDEIAVVGVAERFEAFLVQLRQQFGWTFGPYRSVNVSTGAERGAEIGADVLERIRRENRLDAALHAFAADLQREAVARFTPHLRLRLMGVTWRQRVIATLWRGGRDR